MDLFSRKIVGWEVDDNMEDQLVINALRKALTHRRPAPGLIAHSDRGGQYVSEELRRLLSDYRVCQSMSRADDPYDNAFAGAAPPNPFGAVLRPKLWKVARS